MADVPSTLAAGAPSVPDGSSPLETARRTSDDAEGGGEEDDREEGAVEGSDGKEGAVEEGGGEEGGGEEGGGGSVSEIAYSTDNRRRLGDEVSTVDEDVLRTDMTCPVCLRIMRDRRDRMHGWPLKPGRGPERFNAVPVDRGEMRDSLRRGGATYHYVGRFGMPGMEEMHGIASTAREHGRRRLL